MQADIYWWTGDEEHYWHYLCRLIAKAVYADYRVVVLCPDAAHADALDQKLWSIPANKILPHRRVTSGQQSSADAPGEGAEAATAHPGALRAPVLIIHDPGDYGVPNNADTCFLLNLARQLHPRCAEYGRVATLLPQAERAQEHVVQLAGRFAEAAESLREHVLDGSKSR